MNDEAPPDAYRVTIRYHRDVQQYEIFELEAADLREALSRALERFPARILGSADLVEIRRTNPAR